MKHKLPLLALLLSGISVAACTAPEAGIGTAAPTARPASAEDQRLLTFLDRAFDESAALSPETLTSLGIKQRYDELDDYAEAQGDRELALAESQLARMRADFNPERLSPASRLSFRLFEDQVERARANREWRWHALPVTTSSSPMSSIPVFLINQHRVDTIEDAQAYVSRLRAVERVMNEISANVRRQAEMGIVPPRFVFDPVRADARRVIAGAPFGTGEDSTIYGDFKKKVEALTAPAETKQRLLREGREALTGPFRRGYTTMLSTLDAVERRASGNNGAWSLPRGGEFYEHRLRQSTTTNLSADQIHQIGLNEVARLHREMEVIKQQVGFGGSLQQFFQHIKTGDQFHYSNDAAGREQYLADSRAFIAQVMTAAPQLFHRLPRAPLEVRAVEPWRQETASVAFYNQPSADGSRPGIYYVNLADMRQVLKPQVEAIAYHEGAPGHHFQIALSQELEGVPKFRRFGGYGAYIEGWGLYSERLGQELGFYRDPYSRFGMLSLELWRAVRLVTDTGLHHKRWTREQAIQYFRENSLLSERDIAKEVERYIVWPGQATSYKIGQLKILELRDRARQSLGARFDIRDFHRVVLENGAVPLDVLEELVDAYIAERRG